MVVGDGTFYVVSNQLFSSYVRTHTHTANLKFKTYLLSYTFDRFPKKMKLIPEPSNWAKKRAAKHIITRYVCNRMLVNFQCRVEVLEP